MAQNWKELADICSAFFGETSPHKLVNLILQKASMVMRAERASVFLCLDANSQRFLEKPSEATTLNSLVALGIGEEGIVVPIEGSIVGRCYQLQSAILCNDPSNHPDFNSSVDTKTGFRTQSLLSFPLANHRGVLQLVNHIDGEFKQSDVEKASIFAFIASVALDQIFKVEELHLENNELKSQLRPSSSLSLKSNNAQMKQVYAKLPSIAESSAHVLITGDSGVGKEVLARQIHALSLRQAEAFVEINCASIPENLIEAELFGVSKGAATGTEQRAGKIRLAHKGTLFLDEVGELSLGAQAKLLRVLQDKKVQKVGQDSEGDYVDFRLVSATNRNLEKMVEEKLFREDLFYRLNVVEFCLPSLRERKEDIAELAQELLESFKKNYSQYREKSLSPLVLRELAVKDWPGNIRQLKNNIEAALISSGDNNQLELSHFSFKKTGKTITVPKNQDNVIQLPVAASLKEARVDFDLEYANRVIAACGGNKTEAARKMGISREALRRIFLKKSA